LLYFLVTFQRKWQEQKSVWRCYIISLRS
jgi:hypothetical protein